MNFSKSRIRVNQNTIYRIVFQKLKRLSWGKLKYKGTLQDTTLVGIICYENLSYNSLYMKRLDWTETDKSEALKCESLNDNDNLVPFQNESQPYIAFLNSTIFLLTGSQT